MPAGSTLEARAGWTVVAVSCAIIAIGNASYYVSIVALKPIALEHDWPRAIPSAAYSLAMLGSGIGGILMGRLTDRFGVARPVAFGIAMIAAGCVAASQTTSAWQFLAVHCVALGLVGNAALYGPLVANASLWFDRRRGIAVGLVAAGQGLAGGIWSPVFRHAVETIGWRATFLYYGLFIAVTLLPLTLLLRSPAGLNGPIPRARPGVVRTGFANLTPLALMSCLSVAVVACCVTMSMPIVHVVAHTSDLGHGLNNGARVLSVALLFAIVSRIAWGWASDRIGGLLTLLATSAWQALAMLMLVYVDSLPALYLTAAFFGLGYGGIVPAYAVFMREAFPARGTATRIGVIIMFGTAGMALGAWLAGAVYDLTGSYVEAFALGVAANVLNVLLVGSLAVLGNRAGWRRPSVATA